MKINCFLLWKLKVNLCKQTNNKQTPKVCFFKSFKLQLKAGLHATICRRDLSARQCRSANRTCILTPDPKARLEECFAALVLS